MFKQLKIYYLFVTLPFALLLIGSAVFFNAIKGTIIRNPHPQINYTIFVIILVGGILILISVFRLMQEARNLKEFSDAVQDGTDLTTIQHLASGYTGDVSNVLQLIAASAGRSISHQEQAAIEHEQTNTRTRLQRRNALPQYLSGLLVGMGLFGTFVGLLSTLSDISILINSFADLDMGTASPLLIFRTMIERMRAPMQSMSIAFSASMFGLLGSIVLGFMMVGIRRFQGDIGSVLGSVVARHIETALSYEGGSSGRAPESAAAAPQSRPADDHMVLLRIEERLAEALRSQQRMLASEIDDFQKQRGDMLHALTEQTEANNRFRGDLQQLSRQFETLLGIMDRGNGEVAGRLSELAVQLAGDARESHRLTSLQTTEQKQLREALDSYRIDERLGEALRTQQRSLASELDDVRRLRSDIQQALSGQSEAGDTLRGELQQFGRQLGSLLAGMEKGNGELSAQLSEFTVHMAAGAKESQRLLAQQVDEQKRLRELLERG